MIFAFTLAMTIALPSHGEPTQAQKVRAATAFKLSKYVEWPKEALEGKTEFVVGVVANDDMSEALEAAFGDKTMSDLPVTLKKVESLDDLKSCNLVYFDEPTEDEDYLEVLHTEPILSYGDGEKFAEKSGVVGLFEHGNKIRFNINLRAAREVGLTISSKVLELASQVYGTTE